MKNLASSSILALLLATLAACGPASQSNSVLGEGQNNIIGGTTVVPGSPLSRQVFMIYITTARGGGICTATMITDVIGLTAAHCVDEARGGYALFEIDALRKLENAGSRQQLLKSPRVIPMTSVRVHPAWTGSISRGNNGDIALFKLARPRPSDIEITQIHTEPIRAGQTIVASGYGNNSGSLQMGSGLLRETRVRVLETKVTETEFAVDQKQARGVCSGDSGGPAFVVSPFGRLRQVGIVSYGEEGCENYGVYTYVAPFLPWIQQTIPTMK
ncbi:MAG: S1 family peptidase [Bdellovibrionales bacterium]